jgi:HEAT repeat protein
MNVARVMGNSHDQIYVDDLISAYGENQDDRVKAMIVWALGQLGGHDAASALQHFAADAEGMIKEEIEYALENTKASNNVKYSKSFGQDS